MKRKNGILLLVLFLFFLSVISMFCGCGSSGTGSTSSTSGGGTAIYLKSFTIEPKDPSVPVGLQQQFTATGTYSDGSVKDITKQVIWTSGNTALATINANGLVTTVKAGQVMISAKDPDTFQNQSLTLSITSAILQSLKINPSSPTVAMWTANQLNVVGVYSDGKEHDMTDQVNWTSSDTKGCNY